MIALRFRGRTLPVSTFRTETDHRHSNPHAGDEAPPAQSPERAAMMPSSPLSAGLAIFGFLMCWIRRMIPIVRETLPELPMPIALALAAIGRERPHRYGEHDFPHDGKLREWEAEGRSRALTLMGLRVKPIRVGAQKRVMLGLSRLGRYGRQPERYARRAYRLRGGVFLEVRRAIAPPDGLPSVT
jgi:hypothetical protein